ncbi:MAG: hypothetical protein V3U52_04970 [Thermoplasmata archaeon]
MEGKASILQEALEDMHKNETFERALGRILRAHSRDYEDYLELVSEIRERAGQEKVDIVEAARREASEG